MKKDFLPFAAVMFLCAVFFVVAGALLSFPSLPLVKPTFVPVFPKIFSVF